MRLVQVLCAGVFGLILGACSVQYVSPYSPQIDADAGKLREEIASFGMQMRRDAGRPDGNPNLEANRKLFDAWFAKFDAMTARSSAMAPSNTNCADFINSLSPVWRQSPLRPQLEGVVAAAAPDASAPGASQDCQTLVILRTRAQLVAMQARYNELCAPAASADRCRSQFQRALPGDSGPGIIIQPVLNDLDTIVWIQASKKPKA